MTAPTIESADLAAGRRRVERLAALLGARCVETHISWVLLGADEAWKLKKPLTLPFVDYGSLERRRACCEAELRLNRRYAPSLYLDVSRVVGDDTALRMVAGEGDVAAPAPGGTTLEYAVHMRRFDDDALWSRRLDAGRLGPGDVDALAGWLAQVHEAAPRQPPGGPHATPPSRRAAALAALDGAGPWLSAGEAARLREAIERQARSLAPLWHDRHAGGAVRECHGDLHLDNIITLGGAVQAFDGIEFDPALRWIDIVDDLAFVLMDLQARGRRDLAFRLLDGWLTRTGEHEALPALPLAVAYRALVRAMAAGRRDDREDARRYATTALDSIAPPAGRAPLVLAITHGLPGSGKTTRSGRWLEAHGAVRLRSDVERKRLHGLGALDDSHAAGIDLYGPEATRQTYERLGMLARVALRAGYPVVLDAAFLRRAERDAMRTLATQLGADFVILDCAAPMDELRRRIEDRRGDASEADVAVLERLSTAAEPLDGEESRLVER